MARLLTSPSGSGALVVLLPAELAAPAHGRSRQSVTLGVPEVRPLQRQTAPRVWLVQGAETQDLAYIPSPSERPPCPRLFLWEQLRPRLSPARSCTPERPRWPVEPSERESGWPREGRHFPAEFSPFLPSVPWSPPVFS